MAARDKTQIKIVVEKIRVEGRGAILLTGPSSCGKGEVAKSLSTFLSLGEQQHVSMGDVLRRTIASAEEDDRFRGLLGERFGISSAISVFDREHNAPDLVDKADRYREDIPKFVNTVDGCTQFDWLKFCVQRGLLIPDDWAEQIIDAHFANTQSLRDGIFVLDGYPRTVVAADRLLKTFEELDIGVLKVIHPSITKEQMKRRAGGRGREDDTDSALESRYQFYVEHVQPCIDYLKTKMGPDRVRLVDAHQPVFRADGRMNLERSIRAVTVSVLEALGLPQYLLDLDGRK